METREYTNLLDKFNIIRSKCICCSEDIIYSDTKTNIRAGKLYIKGRSYKTTKTVNDVDYHLRVCQECLLKKFPGLNLPIKVFHVMCEPTKYAFQIPDDVYLSSRQKYAMTKSHMIKKYGQEEGERIWNDYCEKQRLTNTFEYKREKYGWTKEQFEKYNKDRAVTLQNLIDRHGQEEGERIWNDYCEKQRLTKSWDYMVKEFGEEKAKSINEAKSNSLKSMIKRYGVEKGTELYMNRVPKMQKFYSKISQDFFNELDKYLGQKYTTYYATKNQEFGVNLGDAYVFLDYFIKELNLCIEFNGTNFHGDPRVYESNDNPNPFNLKLTAKDIWDADKERREKLKELRNIDTIDVWEIDYKNGIDISYFIKNILKIEL